MLLSTFTGYMLLYIFLLYAYIYSLRHLARQPAASLALNPDFREERAWRPREVTH